MAEQHFSWLPDDNPFEVKKSEPELKLPTVNPRWAWLREKFLNHQKGLVFIAVLLCALFLLKIFRNEDAPVAHKLEVMTALLPIPKGKIIEGPLLRPAQLSPGMLSKSQRLQLVTFGDAEKVMGKVRAKKDIPPNKPLFWPDFELLPEVKNNPTLQLPKIFFSEDSP